MNTLQQKLPALTNFNENDVSKLSFETTLVDKLKELLSNKKELIDLLSPDIKRIFCEYKYFLIYFLLNDNNEFITNTGEQNIKTTLHNTICGKNNKPSICDDKIDIYAYYSDLISKLTSAKFTAMCSNIRLTNNNTQLFYLLDLINDNVYTKEQINFIIKNKEQIDFIIKNIDNIKSLIENIDNIKSTKSIQSGGGLNLDLVSKSKRGSKKGSKKAGSKTKKGSKRDTKRSGSKKAGSKTKKGSKKTGSKTKKGSKRGSKKAGSKKQ